MKHLIKKAADPPDVTFGGVGFAFQDLNWHIEGSADWTLIFDFFVDIFLGESKVTYFACAIPDENVSRLDISKSDESVPMNNALFHQY